MHNLHNFSKIDLPLYIGRTFYTNFKNKIVEFRCLWTDLWLHVIKHVTRRPSLNISNPETIFILFNRTAYGTLPHTFQSGLVCTRAWNKAINKSTFFIFIRMNPKNAREASRDGHCEWMNENMSLAPISH